MNQAGGRRVPTAHLEDGPARRRRPAVVERVTFAELISPATHHRVPEGRLVPIEAARPGDEQVLAARFPKTFGSPLIDLDVLAGLPSVRSVIASAAVRARHPLPSLRELFLVDSAPVPDAATFASLPELASLFALVAPYRPQLDVGALPAASLRELAVARACLPSLDVLAGLGGLRRLVIDFAGPGDSVRPLGALRELVQLDMTARRAIGWAALGACAALEDVRLDGLGTADLRPFRTWSALRRLVLSGAGPKSLAGVEALDSLEHLHLGMMAVGDLGPARGLPRLASVRLYGMRNVRDLGPLGALPALRVLRVEAAGVEDGDLVHVATLGPLAAAEALEEVVLDGAIVDDGDLSPLASLPNLRRVLVYGELEAAVARLRRARPDVEVRHERSPVPPRGTRPGIVTVHPPAPGIEGWWIREDLTGPLGAPTNHDAERLLRRALASEDAALLRRLTFDTEAGAVDVQARTEADARSVAALISRLAHARR
jgi:hypothetical protein